MQTSSKYCVIDLLRINQIAGKNMNEKNFSQIRSDFKREHKDRPQSYAQRDKNTFF